MIGIIPVAGSAIRMKGIPKFILPVPDGTLIDCLMDRMRQAKTDQIAVMASETNFNLLQQIRRINNQPFLLKQVTTNTMSETVLFSRGLCSSNDVVLFGMPDCYVEDEQAFVKLLAADVDVAVGVLRTNPAQHSGAGMVQFDDQGAIIKMHDHPTEKVEMEWAWSVLVWKPKFWQYIKSSEPHVGYAIPRAIDAGLSVKAIPLDGSYYNLGTTEEYFQLLCKLSCKDDQI